MVSGAMAHLNRYLLEGYCYHVISVTRGRRPILRTPRNAKIVADGIQFVRVRAYLLAFAVMPDHFHALLVPKTGESLPKIMQSIKGFTARIINASSNTGTSLWQQSFYDRVIRNESQLLATVEYIHGNPVAAGLVQSANKFPFCSAFPGVESDLEEFLAA